jgi:hypothetical protein
MILYYLNKYLIANHGLAFVSFLYAYIGFVIFLKMNPELERIFATFMIAQCVRLKDNALMLIEDSGLYNHPIYINISNKCYELLLTTNTNPAAETTTERPLVIRYEDKYLTKYKTFPSEYKWNDRELELETKYYNELKTELETNLQLDLNNVRTKLSELDNILNGSEENMAKYAGFDDYSQYELVNRDPDGTTTSDTNCDGDADTESFNVKSELRNIIQTERDKYALVLEDLESKMINSDELSVVAHEKILNEKLDNFMNNYILEHTPVGNVYMRYNNDKKSFEYFSNSSIPYRYLESIGRKYVMTFFCKPLFVDLDVEFERSKQKKIEKEEKEKAILEKKKIENLKKTSKNIFANLKSYNTMPKSMVSSQRPMKNRESQVIPSQFKTNLVTTNGNDPNEHLLKDNANRYTWEGRMHDVSLIKKIPRKDVDKNFSMTFAEFKKSQMNTKL